MMHGPSLLDGPSTGSTGSVDLGTNSTMMQAISAIWLEKAKPSLISTRIIRLHLVASCADGAESGLARYGLSVFNQSSRYMHAGMILVCGGSTLKTDGRYSQNHHGALPCDV